MGGTGIIPHLIAELKKVSQIFAEREEGIFSSADTNLRGTFMMLYE